MNTADTKEAVYNLVNTNRMVLIYFGSDSCNVCNAVMPKIEEILENHVMIKGCLVDIEKNPQAAAAFNIFTIPGILVFIDGKETIREARYISVRDLDGKIQRYYNLLFK